MNTSAPPTLRASHVNTGTSVPADELPWPDDTDEPVLGLPKLHMEIDHRSEVTPYGGLALAAQVAFLLKMPKILGKRVSVLKRHLPSHESDHVLAQAFNLYCGGTCIEDIANLQQSEAVLRLVGACRIPDPTTAGDFLRRFDDEVNPGSLDDLRTAIDEIQNGAWKKTKKRRKARAAERGWKELELVRQWVAEVPYEYGNSDKTYRLVIRRQLIEHKQGQQTLFSEYRYRYVVTNPPKSWTTADVIDATYERCDQEKVIAQLGQGIAAWRNPVAELAGNCAWLEIARLAWNLGKWVAQLALPAEVVRWEWKRFRQAFVVVPAQVLRKAAQIWLRVSGSHRFAREFLAAHVRLHR